MPLIFGLLFSRIGREGLFDVGEITFHARVFFLLPDCLAFGVDALLACHVLFARASSTCGRCLSLNGQLALRWLSYGRTLDGIGVGNFRQRLKGLDGRRVGQGQLL